MAGRGSFTESFGLFGYDLKDYDELFANKLAQLLTVRSRNDTSSAARSRSSRRSSSSTRSSSTTASCCR